MTGQVVENYVVVYNGFEEDIKNWMPVFMPPDATVSVAQLRAFEIVEGHHLFKENYKVKLRGTGTGSFMPGGDLYIKDLEIALAHALDERVGVYQRSYLGSYAGFIDEGWLLEIPYMETGIDCSIRLLVQIKKIRKKFWFWGEKVMVVEVLNFDRRHVLGGEKIMALDTPKHVLSKEPNFWEYFQRKYVNNAA